MRRRRRSTYTRYARRQRFFKHWKIYALIAVAVLALIGAGVYVYMKYIREPEDTIVYEEIKEATLPTVSMSYEGYEINCLRGYTQELDLDYVRRNLYVLEDQYEIPLQITLYGQELRSVSFRLYDTQGERLIQSEDDIAFSTAADAAFATIKIDNIIDESKEYVMKLVLSTEKTEEINYYTRLKRDSATSLKSQLALVLKFNDAVYKAPNNDDSLDYIMRFMATDYLKQTNENFGNVNLYSNYKSVIWGTLRLVPIEPPRIEILDVDGELGYFMLTYNASHTVNDLTEYFKITEYYRVRVVNGVSYILNYERTCDQYFIPTAAEFGNKSVDIGIRSDGNVQYMTNLQGDIGAFIAGDTIWSLDTETKSLQEVFSFSSGVNDIRGNYDQHNYRIVRVTDSGDIQFILYGYMNAGLHEGKVGTAMYTYKADEKKVYEEMFVPSDQSYEILKNSVGKMYYLSSNGVLYMMAGGTLYRIDIENSNVQSIMSGLNDKNSLVSSSSRYIAWQHDAKVNDANAISVLDMETGKIFDVKAAEGSSVKILGFLNQELVYGQGKSGNTFVAEDGNEYLLMTNMYVVDSKNNVQTEKNSGEGFYIDSIDEYNRVIVKQVMKRNDVYRNTEDFTIFATDLDEYAEMDLYTTYDDVKRTTYHIEFAQSMSSALTLDINNKRQILFNEKNTIDINDMITLDGMYYVYAKGAVQFISADASVAVRGAYDLCGVVLDSDGKVFYRRGLMPSHVELSSVTIELAKDNINSGNMVELSGITIGEAMYFTGIKQPLIWVRDGMTYMFVSYDYYDNITMLCLETGEEVIENADDIEEDFPSTGKCYLVNATAN